MTFDIPAEQQTKLPKRQFSTIAIIMRQLEIAHFLGTQQEISTCRRNMPGAGKQDAAILEAGETAKLVVGLAWIAKRPHEAGVLLVSGGEGGIRTHGTI